MQLINLVGRRFGRLIVVRTKRYPNSKEISWVCKCDCGRNKIALGGNLRSGATLSCGCLRKEVLSRIKTIHGHAKKGQNSRAYRSWTSMIDRCTNPNYKQWNYYGGRGIKVCRRWRKFENFLADMGEPPVGTSLDRYPNKNGDYKPNNCRWATAKQQANNRRGRKDSKLTKSDIKEALLLLSRGHKIAGIARLYRVSERVIRYHRDKGDN